MVTHLLRISGSHSCVTVVLMTRAICTLQAMFTWSHYVAVRRI